MSCAGTQLGTALFQCINTVQRHYDNSDKANYIYQRDYKLYFFTHYSVRNSINKAIKQNNLTLYTLYIV